METNTDTSMAVAVGSIWTSVVAISLFAPDMVSGSEQQHLPIAAFLTWIWGLLATSAMFRVWVRGRRRPDHAEFLRLVSFGVAAVWIAAAAVSVFSAEMVTGSDPTRMPVAAILAPIVAVVLTSTAGRVIDALAEV